MYFLGVPIRQERMTLYDYRAEKFVISQDVVFVEDVFPYASILTNNLVQNTTFHDTFNFGEILPIGDRPNARGK